MKKTKQTAEARRREEANGFRICSSETLKEWYMAFKNADTNKCTASMIIAIAELRGFDTSNW